MTNKKPIAIVGLSGIFPGANTIERYWNNIINGVSAIDNVPASRWMLNPESILSSVVEPDKVLSGKAGLITNFTFDPSGFNISKELLNQLDPMYHLALSAGRDAMEGCFINDDLKKRAGVILAAIALPTDSSSKLTRLISGTNFERSVFANHFIKNKAIKKPVQISKEMILASRVTALPASILAKSLNLKGGSYTLDAACSSSLYSIKLACDELQSNRCDLMLAGGVSRPESLFTQTGFSQLTALSPSGICAPFDKSADGLVVGEGAGIIVLKRIDDALFAGDTIYGLLHGAGLTNDIGGNLLAPDTKGQVRAMQLAYKNAGWSPFDIDHIECHGTGTPVGDTIELNSLKTLWGNSEWEKNQCAIGSVKSMVGHLLTAAGIAGTIKTILALKNKTIPPSLNFNQPVPGSPLENGPFYVPTKARKWKKAPDKSRRAAMSAFGFGGTNAHLLIEEWNKNKEKSYFVPDSIKSGKKCAVAITGIGTYLGAITTLNDFQETVFNGKILTNKKASKQKCDNSQEFAQELLNIKELPSGNYIENFNVAIGEFHIPPNEMPDILPQHLLILKATSNAISDANIQKRKEKPRMGVAIGMSFDFEATNFHLRWNMANEVEKWNSLYELNLNEAEKSKWIDALKNAVCPPLSPARTTGALGGIIASRIAKEFKLGGPAFIVSGEETSGLKALEIGMHSIQNDETDTFIAGAVDLPGEIRNIIASKSLNPFSKTNTISPFDKNANGSLPGEGAVAVVLKRLDKAIEDGDRIYAVLKGTGSASSGGIDESIAEEAYTISLDNAVKNAAISPLSIDYIEAHGSGNPVEDNIEISAINNYFTKQITNQTKDKKHPIAIGSIKPSIGHTGAASGLCSLIRASLCLYQEILPPLVNYQSPGEIGFNNNLFHLPFFPQYWLRDRINGPRTACVSSMTSDGNCAHVILEEMDANPETVRVTEKYAGEKIKPLGNRPYGLFVIESTNSKELLKKLNRFRHFVNNPEMSEQSDPNMMNILAHEWHNKNPSKPDDKYCISIIAKELSRLNTWINEAENAVKNKTKKQFNGPDGIYYSPEPLGASADIAFVYPGSGNHYMGMGKGIGTNWPEIVRTLDSKTERLQSQLLPEYFLPYRTSWEDNWESDSLKKADNNPKAAIIAHVSHGVLLSEFIRSFNINPSSIISYSLGESTGYFATQTWTERDKMLKRIEESTLFTEQLAGLCTSARKQWKIPKNKEFKWQLAVVDKAKDEIDKAIKGFKYVKRLIVNTQDECVIGGIDTDVNALIKELNCNAIFINGVVTVHCDAAKPASAEYEKLHLLKTTPPDNLNFYSCYSGKPYKVTRESAAASLLNQALYGFDFTETINNAYDNGLRIFIETGPGSSCCRMIEKILADKPYLCISACVKGEDDYLTALKLTGSLLGERIPVSLKPLYNPIRLKKELSDQSSVSANNSDDCDPQQSMKISPPHSNTLVNSHMKEISIIVGGKKTMPPSPPLKATTAKKISPEQATKASVLKPAKTSSAFKDKSGLPANSPLKPIADLIEPFTKNFEKTAEAHKKFIEFSNNMSKSFADTINFQTTLIEKALITNDQKLLSELYIKEPFKSNMPIQKKESETQHQYHTVSDILAPVAVVKKLKPEPAFSRKMCMEFAVGSIEKVLGPQFRVVDDYDVRVRLPDEPLMLVDRILSVEGKIASLSSGKIVTEHDVHHDAWYLDGGKAPVCISIEAGQADLFLCSYLGIDLAVKGKRSYRLLDAVAQFHGGLPQPGDTIRYEIEIERFINQGETYLFFFNFNGFIGKKHIISMRNGCAGFFTQKEVKESGGIVLTKEETKPLPGIKTPLWKDLVDFFGSNKKYEYDDDKINALRNGEAEKAFGPNFKGKKISSSLAIPGGRMKLVDRVLSLDPKGGRYGLGSIRAQADIYPDSWFLKCHFVDDMVMPGTLMYECCMHTLRIFTMRMGWISDREDVCCEPVPNVQSFLKCRGPVTVETKHVFYLIEIKEIGYNPEPFVIADAHMYAHDEHIVMFRDMSMKLSGITKDEIENYWKE